MTYAIREHVPAPYHDNIEIATVVFDGLTPEQYAMGMSIEDAKKARMLMKDYENLWDNLKSHLQDPIQDTSELFSGYTGHHIVDFDGRMGRCALGFYMNRNVSDENRSIVAYRRRIYADNRRRLNNTSDNLCVRYEHAELYPNNMRLVHRLGVMGVWADKFNAAQPAI